MHVVMVTHVVLSIAGEKGLKESVEFVFFELGQLRHLFRDNAF